MASYVYILASKKNGTLYNFWILRFREGWCACEGAYTVW